jgi:NTP pyrophosphatase (non-canonical NTP hydrolase)
MTFDEYQKQASATAVYSGDDLKDTMHWVLGITGESGEIAEKVKKIIRDKNGEFSAEDKTELAKEIGDVLWYLAALARQIDVSFDDVATANLQKLKSRQARGVLGGSGDNR